MITPVSNQRTSIQPGEPISLIIAAVTMKIPEPIIDPATILVASNNPNVLFNSTCFGIYCLAIYFLEGTNLNK